MSNRRDNNEDRSYPEEQQNYESNYFRTGIYERAPAIPGESAEEVRNVGVFAGPLTPNGNRVVFGKNEKSGEDEEFRVPAGYLNFTGLYPYDDVPVDRETVIAYTKFYNFH